MIKRNIIFTILGIIGFIFVWGIFLPLSFVPQSNINYVVSKGMGYREIGLALEKKGVIANHGFFNAFALMSLHYNNLQAGTYSISSSMSVASIISKIASGKTLRNNLTLLEGWDLHDMGSYLEKKDVTTQKDFLTLTKQDVSGQYEFLKDKPKKQSLEGYLFPDTYEVGKNPDQEELVREMLDNFGSKLTPALRGEIARQHKTVFQVVTMASILEKEVRTLEDKKIVAGILWKRIDEGVPLQVDATVNYVTGKSDARVSLKDATIDSPYNTYKYYGLPAGPICNPGIDSLLAAIYPTKSDYWYYLSANATGKTIFSKTFAEHSAAIRKYLQ